MRVGTEVEHNLSQKPLMSIVKESQVYIWQKKRSNAGAVFQTQPDSFSFSKLTHSNQVMQHVLSGWKFQRNVGSKSSVTKRPWFLSSSGHKKKKRSEANVKKKCVTMVGPKFSPWLLRHYWEKVKQDATLLSYKDIMPLKWWTPKVDIQQNTKYFQIQVFSYLKKVSFMNTKILKY